MLKRLFKTSLWCGILLVAGAGVYLATLIYPGQPSPASSLRFLGFVPLPKSGALNVLDYISIYGDRLFVAGMSAGNVSRVALDGDVLPKQADIAVLPGRPETHSVVIDPIGRKAFVSRSEANTVDIFDPTNMKLIKSIPVADDPDGIFYDPQDRIIYVAGGDSKTGTLIDPAAQTVAGTIALGGKPEFAAFDPQARLLYQNLKDTNEVLAIDLSQRAIVSRWPLSGCEGPSGLALDSAHRKLFVACSTNSRAAIFDLGTHHVLETQPVGGGPDSIAYDSVLNRIYTAGRAGVTTVLEQNSPGAYYVADTIHTHYGAHTLTIDPVTHRVYIGYASLLVAPRLAVFEAVPMATHS